MAALAEAVPGTHSKKTGRRQSVPFIVVRSATGTALNAVRAGGVPGAWIGPVARSGAGTAAAGPGMRVMLAVA